MVPNLFGFRRRWGSHNLQCHRRRRNQPEIDEFVREFRESGLNKQDFAQKAGVHRLTLTRWIRTTSVDGTNPVASGAGHNGYPTSPPRLGTVEVRRTTPVRSSATATFGEWPQIVVHNGGK